MAVHQTLPELFDKNIGISNSRLSSLSAVRSISLKYRVTVKYTIALERKTETNYLWISETKNLYLLKKKQIDADPFCMTSLFKVMND
jgi:hypothetical protein